MTMSLPKKIGFYSLLSISALIMFFRVLYALMISFMTGAEIIQGNIFPKSIHFDNYIRLFDRIPLFEYVINSFIVSIGVMIGQLVVCSLAAYAFVFIPFRGSTVIFYLFISTMMIPWEATMIPNFLTIQKLNW